MEIEYMTPRQTLPKFAEIIAAYVRALAPVLVPVLGKILDHLLNR